MKKIKMGPVCLDEIGFGRHNFVPSQKRRGHADERVVCDRCNSVPGEVMSSREFQGVRVSPDIKVDGGHIVSIEGPIKTIMTYVYMKSWGPSQVVMLGQNGSQVRATNFDEVLVHMIVVCKSSSGNIAQVRGSIDKSLLDALKQDGFCYAHLLAGLDRGVRLAVFGVDFVSNPHAEKITEVLLGAFFRKNGRYKADDAETNTLLLVGDPGERVVVGYVDGREKSFSFLSDPFGPNIEMRNAMVGENLFVCVSCGGKQIAGVSSEDLMMFLISKGCARVVPWSYVQIGCDIEDVAVVDGTNVLIFTLRDGCFRLMPAVVRLNDSGKMSLLPSAAEAVRAEDLQGDIPPSIVRVTKNGMLIFADRQSETTLVRFDEPNNFGSQFEKMIALSLSGNLSANLPATSGL